MTSKIDDGGPAFPIPQQQFTDGYTIVGSEGAPGMSLRDYFAAHAPMPTEAQIAIERDYDKMRNPYNESRNPPLRERHEIVADLMYRHADAMLAAREAKR